MKQISKRITYANVISTLALFLVLGGASALAAGQLGKNSVGAKQLKKNAVTTAKIRNGAVTAAKIGNGAIGGAKLDLGSLGTVPSAERAASAENAAHADNAANAAHAASADAATNAAHAVSADSAATAASATNAGNAATVNGRTVTQVFLKIPASSTATVGTFGDFKIVASCDGSGNVENFQLEALVGGTNLVASGNGNVGLVFNRIGGKTPVSISLDETGANDNERGLTSFSAAQTGGAVVSGTLAYEDSASFGGEAACAVFGDVVS